MEKDASSHTLTVSNAAVCGVKGFHNKAIRVTYDVLFRIRILQSFSFDCIGHMTSYELTSLNLVNDLLDC